MILSTSLPINNHNIIIKQLTYLNKHINNHSITWLNNEIKISLLFTYIYNIKEINIYKLYHLINIY